MDEFEKRGFNVCGHSQIALECCIWAFHERLLETHVLKPSTWRSKKGEPLEYLELLNYVGAKKTSKDVHLPLSMAVRPKSKQNYRKRSKHALAARQEKKAARGYTQWPPASSSSHGGSSSASWTPWAWGSWDWATSWTPWAWGSWDSWEG